MKITRRFAAAAALATLAGCSWMTLPDRPREVGIVVLDGNYGPQGAQGPRPTSMPAEDPNAPVIQSIDTVAAGEVLHVRVTTYARNGCWREAGAETWVKGRVATVTPFDVRNQGMCPQVPIRLPRTVRMTFREPGTATIRVEGRRFDLASGQQGTAVVEKTIIVR